MTAMQNGKNQATTKDKSLASTTKQRKSDNNKKGIHSTATTMSHCVLVDMFYKDAAGETWTSLLTHIKYIIMFSFRFSFSVQSTFFSAAALQVNSNDW